MFTRWCSHCEKALRTEVKNQRKGEVNKLREQLIAEQNSVLEDARKKMLEEDRNDFMLINSEDILQEAQIKAEQFLQERKDSSGLFQKEDLLLLYHVILTPIEMLKSIL